MEKQNFQPLATESFSYSWLTDNNLGSKFAKISSEKPSFEFDFLVTPSASSANSLVHADEIFSNGQIKPLYVEKPRSEARQTSNHIFTRPNSVYSPTTPFTSPKNHYSLGKWRKSSKAILQKCIGFVSSPLCKMSISRKSNRVDDLERKVSEIQSRNDSLEASPRPSSAYSVFEWADVEKVEKKIFLLHRLKRGKSGKISARASPNVSPSRPSDIWFDAENSIHEAILYCKRSIEK